ncbi:MAG: hypothetical protein WBB45_10765 [Cyclobacteriaceae bacterium]
MKDKRAKTTNIDSDIDLIEENFTAKKVTGIPMPGRPPMKGNQKKSEEPAIFNIKLIRSVVLSGIVLIIITHFAMQSLYESNPGAYPFDGLFTITDLDQEQSFGTFTSQLLFVLSALIFSIRFLMQKKGRDKFFLGILAAGLLGMAIDESISLHERTMNVIDTFTDFKPGSFFRFQWLLFGLPLALFILGGLAYLIKTTSLRLRPFLIGLFVFFCGAVGLEGIGGIIDPNHFNYHVWMTGAEESVELIGTYLIFVSQLQWLKDRSPVSLYVK